ITSGASDALQKLAEYLQTPVLTTAEGKGALSDRHYLCLGSVRGNDADLLSQHDVILAVGTRMAIGLSRGSPQLREDQKVVQIDIDPSEIGRNLKNTVGVVGDAKRTLEELQKILAIMTPAKASRKAEMERTKAERAKTQRVAEPQHGFSAAIRAALPDDGILVMDMTQIAYYSRTGYPVYKPGTFITSSYFGNLGYAFPLALGVKVAKPDTPVVSVSGDGGFQYASQELSTAVQYGINLVAVVFNDNAYGNVMRDQETQFRGKLGSELRNPDFVKLAQAYGARGVRVKSAERLESAIKEAIGLETPTVIEVPVGSMPSPW
ncbi:MAG: thiamine pyrophosphate-dependent enzyme, partial [Chloroflexota bacterium]